jgi:hypothetical protein
MNWVEKQIAQLEQTRLDMYRAIQWAERDCRKPSVNIVNLYDLATAEIVRLGATPKQLGQKS